MSLPSDLPPTLVVGAGGFMGGHFLRSYRSVQPACAGTSHSPRPRVAHRLDLREPDLSTLPLEPFRAALVLAALPRIGMCEAEPARTHAVNVEGALQLTRQLLDRGIRPVLFSTDYVWDGETGGYADGAPHSPITVYGRQKAELETRALALDSSVLIVRPGKVYGLVRGDGTVLDEMAGLLAKGEPVRAAFDQVLTPTWIEDVIEAVAHLQVAGASGVVNACAPEAWNRHDLALAIAEGLGVEQELVQRISIDDLGLQPQRPKNTSMRCERLLEFADVSFLSVDEAIQRTIGNWKETP